MHKSPHYASSEGIFRAGYHRLLFFLSRLPNQWVKSATIHPVITGDIKFTSKRVMIHTPPPHVLIDVWSQTIPILYQVINIRITYMT